MAIAQGQKGDRAAVGPLMQMVNREVSSAVWRATAASLLGRLSDPRGGSALIAAMDDSHPMVRMKAVVALGRLGDVRGVPVLLDALSDSARIVRVQAPFALMDIGYIPDESERGDAFRQALLEHRDVVYGVQGDDPGFHESLGQVYERQGRFDDARQEFEIVAKLDPRHPETAADLIRLDKKQKEFEQMRSLLEEQNDPVSSLRLGALMLEYGHYADAVAILGKVRGGSAVLQTAQGNALWGSGDRVAAIEAYGRALSATSGYKPAIRQLMLLVFSANGDANGDVYEFEEMALSDWVNRGVEHALAHEGGLARAAFDRALQIEDGGNTLLGLGRQAIGQVEARADSAFQIGHEIYTQGDLAGALPHYEKAQQLNPNRSDVHSMQGLIRADLGAFDLAKVHLQDALIIDPAYVPALTVLGTVLQEQDNLDGALSLYRQAWALEPAAPGLELFMAQIYAMKGNRDS
ncbi:MAG: tetratricopeptide repeat protein, partial [Candidatus Latescibacteria bacterium]|nr:tetratricopeptide repeat protein [Candidatus Latescibacterota bacterium]